VLKNKYQITRRDPEKFDPKKLEGGTMRSILILAILGALFLPHGASYAETNDECRTRCSAEKASNDENCSHAEETFDKTRAQCLQENQVTFNNCINGCPQTEPTDTPEAK
jgi:hypothetical protein